VKEGGRALFCQTTAREGGGGWTIISLSAERKGAPWDWEKREKESAASSFAGEERKRSEKKRGEKGEDPVWPPTRGRKKGCREMSRGGEKKKGLLRSRWGREGGGLAASTEKEIGKRKSKEGGEADHGKWERHV